MARLGELLVAAGLVTAEQVEQALRAQVMWGGRIGTNLIELCNLDLDDLAKALGRQRRVPAALTRHFERSDRALQDRLPAVVAEHYGVLPLFRAGPHKDRVAVVSHSPLGRDALARVADALGVPVAWLVPSIACELRMAYHLERVYQIPRDLRFLRPRNKTVPAFLHFEVIPVPPDSEPELVLAGDTLELPALRRPPTEPEPEDRADTPLAIDDLEPSEAHGIEPELEDDATMLERRRYVRTITDEILTESEPQAVGRISLRRIAVSSAPGGAGASLVEAVRAIRHSTGRDRVADLVLDAIDRFVPACEAAMLLVKRGDVAIGWKGFSRSGAEISEIAVPIGPPAPQSLVSHAIDTETSTRAPATGLAAIDQLLHRSLAHADGELAIVPISIGGQVMCAIALVLDPDAGTSAAEALAAAAGAAFARLMRDAAR